MCNAKQNAGVTRPRQNHCQHDAEDVGPLAKMNVPFVVVYVRCVIAIHGSAENN